MKAIILAAGYATRLYPLTRREPKALLPVNGKPIIDYIMDQLRSVAAVDEVIVVSNHKFAPRFFEWAAQADFEKPVTVLDDGSTSEENRRGAVGDIYFAVSECGIDDEIMVIAGDNLFTFKLTDCFGYYKSLGKDCVVAKEINDVSLLRRFAVAGLDHNGRVVEFEEKPENPKNNMAVFATYLYKKDTVPLFGAYLEQGNNPDAPGYFVQWLHKRKDVYAYKMDGDCYDVGTHESYEEAQEIFARLHKPFETFVGRGR